MQNTGVAVSGKSTMVIATIVLVAECPGVYVYTYLVLQYKRTILLTRLDTVHVMRHTLLHEHSRSILTGRLHPYAILTLVNSTTSNILSHLEKGHALVTPPYITNGQQFHVWSLPPSFLCTRLEWGKERKTK